MATVLRSPFCRLLLVAAWATIGCANEKEPEPPTLPHARLVRLPSEVRLPRMEGTPSLALGDCNGDGLIDVVMAGASTGERLFVRRSDGTLQDELLFGEQPNWSPDAPASIASFSDLDGDGQLDLVLASSSDGVQNAGVTILKGRGNCSFDPRVRVLDLMEPHAPILGSVQVTDVDLDGLADIIVTFKKEPHRIFKVLLGLGDGHYVQMPVAPTPYLPLEGYLPFGTFWEDVDGDGVRDLFAPVDFGGAWFSWGVPGLEPSYARDENVSKTLSRVHAMGIAPLDFDRNGTLDYFISGLHQANLLLEGGSRAMTNRADAVGLNRADMVQPSKAWGSYTFDAELDGWPDLLVIRTLDPDDSPTAIDPGPPIVFHNQRDGRFVLESELKSRELWTDARSMWCGDLRSDGHAQCYLRTTSGEFPILRAETEAVGHWVGVRLRGTVSSPEADGARIFLSGANPPQMLYAGAATPTDAQHDRGVLIPIGLQTEAAIDIHWPSGIVQHVEGLQAGRYQTIVEPKVLTVSRRVVPADSTSTVVVSVDSKLTNQTVSIEREGRGEWLGPVALDDTGQWTRTLRASDDEGLAKIVVTLGSIPLKVQPRIHFVLPR